MGKVLVVEDDPSIRDALHYSLRQEQHEVLTASDGIEAIEIARAAEPELVVLDLMLPRMSGLDVCRVLRAESPVLILMLSAKDEEVDRVVGLEMGADDYVVKPFSMRELLTRIASLLRRDRISRQSGREHYAAPSSNPREVFEFGDFVLDVTAHELLRRGSPVALRPREFELLEYLLRHPRQVLTRDMILRGVWGYSFDGQSRTVDVHVRWLREKIEADPANPQYVLTVRQVGYKFVPQPVARATAPSTSAADDEIRAERAPEPA